MTNLIPGISFFRPLTTTNQLPCACQIRKKEDELKPLRLQLTDRELSNEIYNTVQFLYLSTFIEGTLK